MSGETPTGSNEGRSQLLWHLCGVVLVVLVPTLTRLGLPYWELQDRLVPQVPALAIGYLATALLVAFVVWAGYRYAIAMAAVIGALAFGAAFLIMVYLPGFDYSRLVVATGVAIGLPLAVLPYFLPQRPRTAGVFLLAPLAFAVVGWSTWTSVRLPETAQVESRDRVTVMAGTVLQNLSIDHHHGLVDRSPSTGGGVVEEGGRYIVANGVGKFHSVSWAGYALHSEPMALPPVLERDAFIAANSLEVEAEHFRIMDLLVDTTVNPTRLLVSHFHWDGDERCVAMRISAIGIPPQGTAGVDSEWETLFTTRPCIPVEEATAPTGLTNHTGGQMEWAPDGGLLYTVGDFLQDGRDGKPTFPQESGNDYGKVLRLDLAGGTEIVSMGHRNPQGLLVARDGTIWSTEHGPIGGDELNLIREGANYGWPLATYGANSEPRTREGPQGVRDHGSFEEPRYAWVPSIGISNLIELRGEEFPAWEGDFLVASLNGQSLYRVRMRNGAPVYTERIPVVGRLRDILQDEQGRILIWSDYSVLVSITNAGDVRTGEVVYAQCATCHESGFRVDAIAPDLRGVMGRQAGAVDGFVYSEAMQSSEVTWSPETLSSFLTNPSGFIPGTNMNTPGLSAADRQSIIEYLSDFN